MTDNQISHLITNNQHNKALKRLYKNYPSFNKWMLKMGGTKTEVEDIFQEALLIIIEKIQSGFQLSCSFDTYLFSICKNLSYEYFRSKGKNISITDNDIIWTENAAEYLEKEKKLKQLDNILRTIDKKCMDILIMFYYKGLSMDDIAKKIGFKSVKSAKTQKYKCLEKARKKALELMPQNFNILT